MKYNSKLAKPLLERMRAKHPAAFSIPIRPLKLGIREDLIAAGWTADEVSQALSYYPTCMPPTRWEHFASI